MAEGNNGIQNVDTTTNFGKRDTIQTEPEAEHMPNTCSTEGCDNRNDFVSLIRECENASHICDNETNSQRSEHELQSQESSREDTSSSKADCENKTEITGSLQNVVKNGNNKEYIRDTISVAGGIDGEDIVNFPSKVESKMGICNSDTNVESNGNMLESDYKTKSGKHHYSTFADESWNESGETCTPNKSDFSCETKSKANIDLLCYPPTLFNQDAGSIDRKEGGASVVRDSAIEGPREEKDSKIHGREIDKERLETARNVPESHVTDKIETIESESTLHDSRQTKFSNNYSYKVDTCYAASSAATIDTQSHVAPSAKGAAEKKMRMSTSSNIQQPITPEPNTTEQHASEITVNGDEVRQETATTPPENVSEEISAIVDRDEDFIIVQSIIKTPQRIIAELETDQQANLSKCVRSVSRLDGEGDQHNDLPEHGKQRATSSRSHNARSITNHSLQGFTEHRESRGIVDRDEVFTIVQSNSKKPQRIIAEQETDQQANLSRKHSKCVTSVSRHDGEGDRHNDLPEHGKQQATSSRSHNARSITNHSLQGYTEHSESRGLCVRNPPSNRKQRRFKSKQQPTKNAVLQESSNQSIFTGERSECVPSSARLHNGQHNQRKRLQANGIPFVNVRNQDSEADIRPSTSRGRVFDGRTTGHAYTGQRRSKNVSGPRTPIGQESSSQTELAENHTQRITPSNGVVDNRQNSQCEQRQFAVQFGNVRTRRVQAMRRAWANRGRNEGDGDDGGDDDGDGGEEANRRLFNCRCLTVCIQSRSEFQTNHTVNNLQLGRLVLNTTDSNRIKRFFRIKGFHFLFKDQISNAFVFHTGNRSESEVIEVLNEINDRLKQLCFARFFGTTVNGIEIANPNDLVISFGFRVINGQLNNIPSTQMVV